MLRQGIFMQENQSTDQALDELVNDIAKSLKQGRFEDGLRSANEIISSYPERDVGYYLRGLLLMHQSNFKAAEASFADALIINHSNLESYLELSSAQLKLGKTAEASQTLDLGLSICVLTDMPGDQSKRIGNLYYNLGRFFDSEKWLNEFLNKEPNNIPALEMLASCLQLQNKNTPALEIYQKVLQLGFKSGQTFRNIAVILTHLGERDLALHYYEQAALEDPAYNDPCAKLMSAASTLNFEKRDLYALEAIEHIKLLRGDGFIDPFSLLFCTDDPSVMLEASRQYAKKSDTVSLPSPSSRSDNSRIKIGYMSADFKTHATTFLMRDLIKEHDRSKFEIIAIDFSTQEPSSHRDDMLKLFDGTIHIVNDSDQTAAYRIAQANIDILVDLKGYTRGCRPAILAFKPAPIQVNYLGFPGTMGNKNVDYIIGDPIVTPAENKADFDEEILNLECCYQPNTPSRKIPAVSNSISHGLNDAQFIFACFNMHWKWNSTTLASWAEILERCPEAVLWALDLERVDVKKTLKRFGIEPDRIVLAPKVPLEEHLERISHANLFLDTFPCGAHTTASDSIRQGVPVLTLQGQSFHSRVSSSIVTFAGSPELVCHSWHEYIQKAVYYYENRDELSQIKIKIQDWSQKNHPFNVKNTARCLEKAYELMLKLKSPK
jgi:protein O-GlcNAc transferase